MSVPGLACSASQNIVVPSSGNTIMTQAPLVAMRCSAGIGHSSDCQTSDKQFMIPAAFARIESWVASPSFEGYADGRPKPGPGLGNASS